VKAEFLPGVSYPPFSCRADPFLAFETESFRVFFKPAGMHSIPASTEAGKHLPSGARRKLPGLEIPESPFQSDLLSWVKEQYPDQGERFARGHCTGANNAGLDSADLRCIDLHCADTHCTGARSQESLAHPRAEREIGMLSRLDKETSGLVAFARSPELFFHALEGQSLGRSWKRYWLLVQETLQEEGLSGSKPPRCFWNSDDPVVSGREFAVESLFRSFGPRGQRVACIAPELEHSSKKKLSPNLYRSVFSPAAGALDLSGRGLPDTTGCLAWEASISAGFRHQLRAHMAWCGHPILGDVLYGAGVCRQAALTVTSTEADHVALSGKGRGTGRNSQTLAGTEIGRVGETVGSRLFLECHRLELDCPGGGQEIFELDQG
jgi:23S rRNA pseudouridine1911/1915/1917 synthase